MDLSGFGAFAAFDPSSVATGEVSTDEKYRRHQFVTWQGETHWTSGWTYPEARNATAMHLRGWFYASAALARDAVKYPPIMAGLRQRTAPPLRTKWRIEGPDRAPGRYAVEDLQAVWDGQFRPRYGKHLRELCMMGFSVIHVHYELDIAAGLERPVLKRWPHEAITWRPGGPSWRAGYYAVTADSGLVPIVNGDGHWVILGHDDHPHEMGAILALDMSYVGGQLARRDEAGLSEGAGRAAPVANLPKGVKPDSAQGLQVGEVVAGLGLARTGAVLPFETELNKFQIVSDTKFFVDYSASQRQNVAYAILGVAATMTNEGGAVYTAPVFEGVLTALVDGDHEATERGWNRGIALPYEMFNGYEAGATRLVGDRVADPAEAAKSEGARALALGAAVKSWHDAGLVPAQGDVDALAAAMKTRTIAIGEKPPVKIA